MILSVWNSDYSEVEQEKKQLFQRTAILYKTFYFTDKSRPVEVIMHRFSKYWQVIGRLTVKTELPKVTVWPNWVGMKEINSP